MKKSELKNKFKQALNQFETRIIKEQSFREAQGGLIFPPNVFIKNTDFDKIYNEGITRKINHKTVRYTGEEAVLLQINTLKNRASVGKQKSNFIDNYVNSMRNVGFQESEIITIKNKLLRLSNDKLKLLTIHDYLPPIDFIYSIDDDTETTLEEINDAIDYANSNEFKEQLINTQKKAKALENNIKERYNILKG